MTIRLLIGVAFCMLLCSCNSAHKRVDNISLFVDYGKNAIGFRRQDDVCFKDGNVPHVDDIMAASARASNVLHEVNATIKIKYVTAEEQIVKRYWATWIDGELIEIVFSGVEASVMRLKTSEGSVNEIQKVTLNVECKEGKGLKEWGPSEWVRIRTENQSRGY